MPNPTVDPGWLPESTPGQSPLEPRPEFIPPLRPGDHLTLEEFQRRYEAMPHLKKAELIEGVVYMPPPVAHEYHGRPHFRFGGILGIYSFTTPGVEGGDNSTVRGFRGQNEPQPDNLLYITPEFGGRCRLDEKGYLHGPPELVGEIAYSSASYDLHVKKEVYRKNGVREYIVWR